MKESELIQEIEIPEGVVIESNQKEFVFKGKKGEVKLSFIEPNISIAKKDNKIILKSSKGTKREKKLLFTFRAKIKNAFTGVIEGFIYELKICSSHFPMNVSVNNNIITIKNFLGEKVPRTFNLKKDNVKVNVQGDKIIVESCDKESAGQTAANIEQLCRRPGFDKRIFQDGIYITKKAGKEI